MRGAKTALNILRWTARIISIFVALVFIIFFVGEGIIGDSATLTVAEVLMLICVPVFLLISLALAWKNELLGGILTIACIIVFNIIAMISENDFSFRLDFYYFIIIGLLFIICHIGSKYLEKKQADNIKKEY